MWLLLGGRVKAVHFSTLLQPQLDKLHPTLLASERSLRTYI
jgi:hypothetical protein